MPEVNRQGPEDFPRYTIVCQGRVWNGKAWRKRWIKPLLFADFKAAKAEAERVDAQMSSTTRTVSQFVLPLVFDVVSDFPFSAREALRSIQRWTNWKHTDSEMPEGARITFLQMDSNRATVVRQISVPPPDQVPPAIIEVPLRIRVSGRTDFDAAELEKWLKRNVHIECGLKPTDDPSISSDGYEVGWSQAKLVEKEK